MAKKNIKNMSAQELKEFIKEKKQIIYDNNKKLNTYYKELQKQYDDSIKSDNIHNLRQNAYDIKNKAEHIEWAYTKQIINNNIKKRPVTIPKRGEIWTCQFGKNIGSEQNKIRPAIIIQNDTGNEKSPTTIVVPISNRSVKIATHIFLRKSDYQLIEGEESEVTGTILCEQIKVISKARLGRHVGTLNDDFVEKFLNVKLRTSLEI